MTVRIGVPRPPGAVPVSGRWAENAAPKAEETDFFVIFGFAEDTSFRHDRAVASLCH
jgi:hypothetical protein